MLDAVGNRVGALDIERTVTADCQLGKYLTLATARTNIVAIDDSACGQRDATNGLHIDRALIYEDGDSRFEDGVSGVRDECRDDERKDGIRPGESGGNEAKAYENRDRRVEVRAGVCGVRDQQLAVELVAAFGLESRNCERHDRRNCHYDDYERSCARVTAARNESLYRARHELVYRNRKESDSCECSERLELAVSVRMLFIRFLSSDARQHEGEDIVGCIDTGVCGVRNYAECMRRNACDDFRDHNRDIRHKSELQHPGNLGASQLTIDGLFLNHHGSGKMPVCRGHSKAQLKIVSESRRSHAFMDMKRRFATCPSSALLLCASVLLGPCATRAQLPDPGAFRDSLSRVTDTLALRRLDAEHARAGSSAAVLLQRGLVHLRLRELTHREGHASDARELFAEAERAGAPKSWTAYGIGLSLTAAHDIRSPSPSGVLNGIVVGQVFAEILADAVARQRDRDEEAGLAYDRGIAVSDATLLNVFFADIEPIASDTE